VEQVVNAIVLGACYCLFAVGLGLTWGSMNILNLAHGAVFMFSAFCCYVITLHVDPALPVAALVVVAIVAGGLLESFLYILVFQVIQRRDSGGDAELAMLIASIGVAAILEAIVQNNTVADFTLSVRPVQPATIHLGGTYISSVEIAVVAAAILSIATLAVVLRRTRLGRAMRAVSCDPRTSSLMGINGEALGRLVFAISGMTAGMAGAFLCLFFENLSADSGSDLLLKAFAVVVLGGVGSMWGTFAAGFALAAVETVVTATTSGTWTEGVSFLVIIAVLLVRPEGLVAAVRVDRA
jgi:branched-chain amino acid transport system permease protein